MWFLKIALLVCFLIVLVQDFKDRKVYWFLYPLIGIMVYGIHFREVGFLVSAINAVINLLFVSIILLVSFFYAKWKLKKHFTKEVLGQGDILFFLFISFSFSSVSFVVLFVFSLLFSLLMHCILNKKDSSQTVPLAGYMSLFFGAVYGVGFFCETNFLYAY